MSLRAWVGGLRSHTQACAHYPPPPLLASAQVGSETLKEEGKGLQAKKQ